MDSPSTHRPPRRIVVVGGGVIGVCTAYFLTKRLSTTASDYRVTLVEQSAAVATAASGKAGGFLALDWCDGGPVRDLARASFALHRSLAEELDGAQSYGYRPMTTLSVPINESDLPSSSHSNGDGLPAWVDGTGRPRQRVRTIGTTENTAQVHPQLFTRALLEKAVRDFGLEVVVGRRVGAVNVDGEGKVRSVVMEGEGGVEVEAEAVVVAAGPWSGKFGLLDRVFGVYGLKAHSIVLEPREKDEITSHALFLSFSPKEGGPALDPEVYPRPTGTMMIMTMG